MVDNINIPLNVEKVIKVEVTDTSEPLKRLLTDLIDKVQQLETDVEDHEDRIVELEP